MFRKCDNFASRVLEPEEDAKSRDVYAFFDRRRAGAGKVFGRYVGVEERQLCQKLTARGNNRAWIAKNHPNRTKQRDPWWEFNASMKVDLQARATGKMEEWLLCSCRLIAFNDIRDCPRISSPPNKQLWTAASCQAKRSRFSSLARRRFLAISASAILHPSGMKQTWLSWIRNFQHPQNEVANVAS